MIENISVVPSLGLIWLREKARMRGI